MNTSHTIEEIESILGNNVRKLRLLKNISREALAERAGTSVTAIKNLESGKGATTRTLLKVVRSLGREDWLQSLAPVVTINPLHLVKDKTVRVRASGRKVKIGNSTP